MAWNVCQTCSRVLIFKPICMKSFFISLFIAVCANLSVFAQTKFSISYEDTVNVGEPVKIKYIASNPQPIGFRGNLLVKRQKFFYCTYSLGITETS